MSLAIRLIYKYQMQICIYKNRKQNFRNESFKETLKVFQYLEINLTKFVC